jgi:hypothetical protein
MRSLRAHIRDPETTRVHVDESAERRAAACLLVVAYADRALLGQSVSERQKKAGSRPDGRQGAARRAGGRHRLFGLCEARPSDFERSPAPRNGSAICFGPNSRLPDRFFKPRSRPQSGNPLKRIGMSSCSPNGPSQQLERKRAKEREKCLLPQRRRSTAPRQKAFDFKGGLARGPLPEREREL